MKKSAGFSLIDLMVVVAIIGFLTAIGMTVYADVQAKGRDAKRKADIDSLAKVLEIHRTDSGGYSTLQATWFGSSTGVPTTDPKGYSYCINSDSTVTTIDDATSANWDTSTKECKTPYLNVSTVTGAKPSGNTQWKICTLLEYPVGVYCRYSVQ